MKQLPRRRVGVLPNEQVRRNRMVLEYRRMYPDATYAEIGALFRITRQRVFQIIQSQSRAG